MTDIDLRMIGKYAVLLSIAFLIEFAFRKYIRLMDLEFVTMTQRVLIYGSPEILTLVLNIITSVIVYRDKVTKKIETKYVIVATILYRPVGVVALLLYSIYNKDPEDTSQKT